MQHIAQHAPQPQKPAASPARSDSDAPQARVALWGDRDPAAVVRRVWTRLRAIYGHRWSSAHGDDPAQSASGPEWTTGLRTLTVEQIGRAIDACRDGLGPDDGWPPSLPQFRLLALGVPSFATVQREAWTRDAIRSPFTRLVLSMCDSWRYRNADRDTAERLLREAYADARAHVLAGGALPEDVPALTAEPEQPRPSDPAAVEAARAAMRAELDGIA